MKTKRSEAIASIGKKFHMLTVVAVPEGGWKDTMVEVVCNCGIRKIMPFFRLRHRRNLSCRCQIGKATSKHKTKHGGCVLGRNAVYRAWWSMIDRCRNSNNQSYKHYGGRGIKVCARWKRSFVAFRKDMGPKLAGMSLDRKDSNGNYTPVNCRWATWAEQTRNTRRNVWIEFRGQRMILADFARLINKSREKIRWRLRHGWTIDEVVGL